LAIVIKLLFVIDGKTEPDFGVINLSVLRINAHKVTCGKLFNGRLRSRIQVGIRLGSLSSCLNMSGKQVWPHSFQPI
jgi:hypothetical protein